MSASFNPIAALFTTSELSLTRSLNSLLPPAVQAAEIPSFKPRPDFERCSHNGNGGCGSMTTVRLFNATHLPQQDTVKRLATRLNMSVGITFFVVEPSAEVENLVDRVYSHCSYYTWALQMGNGPPQSPPTSEICEVLAMAAVGSQYDREASASLREACFNSARFGLDDAIEEADADAGDDVYYRVLKILALLAIYQILEKRGSCWKYIGIALNIARAKGLDRFEGVTTSPFHLRMRKLWRTLVCLESLIGATLGKLSTTIIDLDQHIRMGDPVFCYPEDSSYPALDSAEGSLATWSLQIAVARIAIFTASIQRAIYSPDSSGDGANNTIDVEQIRYHKALLEQWFNSLPDTLSLSALLSEDVPTPAASTVGQAITFAERSSMLLGHCLYLSAIMLLSRCIFLSVVSDIQGYNIIYRGVDEATLSPEWKEALGHIRSCLTAANLTGCIMGLMVSQDRLVSKCWLAIYPAFNACLLLLFHVTQRRLWCRTMDFFSVPELDQFQGEGGVATVGQTTENAKKCLAALEYCASGGDGLSEWYLQVLAPFRKALEKTAEGDPVALSADMYSALAVSAQCSFHPPRVASVGAGYSDIDSWNLYGDPPASPSYAFCPEIPSFSAEVPPSIPSASDFWPGIPLPSSSPSAEVLPNMLYPSTAYAQTQGTHGQEYEGMRPHRQPNLQSPQPGEEIARSRGVKRKRQEPYIPELEDPTDEELAAFFRRVV